MVTLRKRRIKRRMTPADRPEVLQEWKELEKHYVEVLGLSRHAAHRRIAQTYNTTTSNVYVYLTGRGRSPAPPYSEAVSPRHLARASFYERFRYNPARYIVPLYSNADEAISLEELSTRLHAKYGYLPHVSTLEKHLISGPSFAPVLVEVSGGRHSRYRVATRLYEKYKPE